MGQKVKVEEDRLLIILSCFDNSVLTWLTDADREMNWGHCIMGRNLTTHDIYTVYNVCTSHISAC